ncbi:hypothetical protein LMG27177_03743 [Paraburkholderia fynbosensis]|uniref:Uncharacterized protein n=1 Tax=Paraburkholderia fynbosensis TaxID=1200993 RepID=A0A6J5G7C7_9BURK|nr:hypothetical protein LMG27177_03743 [Paraburkholderia fynbosensis]
MTNRNVVGYGYLREATVLKSDPLKEFDYTAPLKERLLR